MVILILFNAELSLINSSSETLQLLNFVFNDISIV